jgi:hypothetical protein
VGTVYSGLDRTSLPKLETYEFPPEMSKLPYLWGGWYSKLRVLSKRTFDYEPTNIQSLGYLDMPARKSFGRRKPSNRTTLCPLYQIYDPDLTQVPVEPTHGWINPDWNSMVNQVKLFDHNDDDDIPDISDAEKIIIEMFDFYNVHSNIISLEEVTFNEKANAGVGYQEIYGNKGTMLKYGREEIESYWATAHMVKALPLSYLFPKVEYLPWEKVWENNARSIEAAPLPHLAYQLRCCQSFNKKMYKQHDKLPVKVGVNFNNGGFNKLIRSITLDGKKFQGDIRKFDKNFRKKLRLACKRVRLGLYRGAHYGEFKERMDFIYEYSILSPVIMPWGQVLMLPFMKSGDGNTTSDNCIGHLVIIIKMVIVYFPGVRTWRDVFYIIEIALYADDNIGCTSNKNNFLATFECRRKFYGKFGFELKQEDDIVSDRWESLTFLGAKIIYYEGMFAPQYSLGRIWSAIIYNKLDDPVGIYNKMCSMLILTTFNGQQAYDQVYNVLKFYIEYFDDNYGKTWTTRRSLDGEPALFKKGMPFLPYRQWCVNFWNGYETKENSSRVVILDYTVFLYWALLITETSHEFRRFNSTQLREFHKRHGYKRQSTCQQTNTEECSSVKDQSRRGNCHEQRSYSVGQEVGSSRLNDTQGAQNFGEGGGVSGKVHSPN